MVTSLINDTRCLSLELTYSSLGADVRTNVEIRMHDGSSLLGSGVNEKLIAAAISETLQVHADFFRVEVIKNLPKSPKARAKAFDLLNAVVNAVGYSPRWQEHNWDQLDLFDQAGAPACVNLVSQGSLMSVSEHPELVVLNSFASQEAFDDKNSARDEKA